MPQVQALNLAWRFMPPPAMALRRISAYLGLKEPTVSDGQPSKPQDALQQALAAGIPVMQGRPDDPLLAFLDLPT